MFTHLRIRWSIRITVLMLAMLATSSQAALPNDYFTNSIQLDGAAINVTGSFVGATLEPDETAPFAAGSEGRLTIWYSWAPPITGRAYFTSVPGSITQRILVYVGSDLANLRRVPLVQRAGNYSFLATAGTVYHFQIGGVAAHGDTSVNLNVELRPEVPCDNDNFADAALLKGHSFNTWYSGGAMPPLHWTLGATTEMGEPAHRLDGPGNSLWWKWVASLHGRFAPETGASTASNIVMAIYQGATVQSLTLLGRFTNSSSPGISVTAGETYYLAASVTNEVGDVFVAGFASGNTSFTPVPGNLLLNPSFEQGVLFDYWSKSGGAGGYVGENGGADGRSWPSLGGTTILWQDVPTIPGHHYRIRFIWRFGGDLSGGAGARACNVWLGPTRAGDAFIPATEAGQWHCPTFIVTATSTNSRFQLQNGGLSAEFDGLSLVDITAGPVITTQPHSISTVAGGTAAFVVGVSGSEPMSYRWFFNGTAVASGMNRVLVIEPASNSHAGAYHVVVSNAFGAVTSSVANLIVESPTYPVILWQPYSETVPSGGYVSLNVVAAGTAPLNYQWFRNDQSVANATNSALTFASVQPADAGIYKVRVSNNAGSVWSLPAALVVTATNVGGARIRFDNKSSPFGLANDAPVLDVDAFTRLNGSNYLAQLYAGATLAELRPAGTPSPFYSGFSAGFFVPQTITLPNIAPGSNVFAQVRAWDRSRGATYEAARAMGGRHGKSAILNITTRPPIAPAIGLEGLQTFSLQAGLPYFSAGIIRLSHREPGGVVVWSLQGEPNSRYVIEKAVQDFAWKPYLVLTNITGTVTFTDSANSGAHVVVFRARILD